jgi:glycosyltransferase involved in cell wall biosynthesis
MKITVICPELSNNSLGRAYILAKALRQFNEVEIIGMMSGQSIWFPCDTGEFEYASIEARTLTQRMRAIPNLLRLIEGDVIYAVKPRLGSYGVSLLGRVSKHYPVVLDIDDWELGFQGGAKWWQTFPWRWVDGLDGALFLYVMEMLVPVADRVTVSSYALQQRFGGTIVPHGRDTHMFDPAKYDSARIRENWGISHKKVIMFLGTPRPHKGLEDIVRAMKQLNRPNLLLIVVGAQQDGSYEDRLQRMGGEQVRLVGMQPFWKIPLFLSMADMVVLPQRNVPSAIGQVPAKVFDAMAMAKPIIATRVCDLPIILDGCGRLVPPGDVSALAREIDWVLSNPKEANQMGELARQKCIEQYSIEAMRHSLKQVLDSLPI